MCQHFGPQLLLPLPFNWRAVWGKPSTPRCPLKSRRISLKIFFLFWVYTSNAAERRKYLNLFFFHVENILVCPYYVWSIFHQAWRAQVFQVDISVVLCWGGLLRLYHLQGEVVVLYCFFRASGVVLDASLNFKFGLFSWWRVYVEKIIFGPSRWHFRFVVRIHQILRHRGAGSNKIRTATLTVQVSCMTEKLYHTVRNK